MKILNLEHRMIDSFTLLKVSLFAVKDHGSKADTTEKHLLNIIQATVKKCPKDINLKTCASKYYSIIPWTYSKGEKDEQRPVCLDREPRKV